ncbi:hypothetical protein [Candidatus Phytoplasma pini]|uniref:Uncharacterized protein n=1 Tax=Candidatus Phytoplasma pini TaxID=267362 RepID=A0A559KJH8_9MOLU|nr:hypothetical protein [Candidatus Phytoplasma pini]TVY12269.1 hypothetical protein MDPP_00216 [Candidatus Phytoplasma pini]
MKKKYIIIFILKFFIILIFIYLVIEKQKSSTNNEKTELEFIHKLAILGLENFDKGMNQTEDIELKKHYERIYEADPETFRDKVFNNNLSTASTLLIYSTIDFLSQKLEKKINLKVNKIDCYTSFFSFKNEIINLELKNSNDHFFINKPNDTLGDGYCFFHAITYLLNEIMPNWKSKFN